MRQKPSQNGSSIKGLRAAALLKAALSGSTDAVGNVLETCRSYLVLIAQEELDHDLRAKVGASDLVQETFVAAQRNFARFEGRTPEDLLAWLRGILLKKLQDARRQYKTDKRHVSREVPLDGMKSAARQVRERPSKMASPSRQAAASEETARMSLALSSLSPDHQKVIQLRIGSCLASRRSAAEWIARPAQRARLWVRALEQLAATLEQRDDG